MVGQGEKYNAGRIPQREASRLKWLDKDRNIMNTEKRKWLDKQNAGRIQEKQVD